MSSNTEFRLDVEINWKTPQAVIDILAYMARDDYDLVSQPKADALPDHPFFKELGWHNLLRMGVRSFYGKTTLLLSRVYETMTEAERLELWHSVGGYAARLFVWSYYNYVGDLIPLFLHWLAPYVNDNNGRMVGYHQHEDELWPTFITFDNGTAYEHRRSQYLDTNQFILQGTAVTLEDQDT